MNTLDNVHNAALLAHYGARVLVHESDCILRGTLLRIDTTRVEAQVSLELDHPLKMLSMTLNLTTGKASPLVQATCAAPVICTYPLSKVYLEEPPEGSWQWACAKAFAGNRVRSTHASTEMVANNSAHARYIIDDLPNSGVLRRVLSSGELVALIITQRMTIEDDWEVVDEQVGKTPPTPG